MSVYKNSFYSSSTNLNSSVGFDDNEDFRTNSFTKRTQKKIPNSYGNSVNTRRYLNVN